MPMRSANVWRSGRSSVFHWPLPRAKSKCSSDARAPAGREARAPLGIWRGSARNERQRWKSAGRKQARSSCAGIGAVRQHESAAPGCPGRRPGTRAPGETGARFPRKISRATLYGLARPKIDPLFPACSGSWFASAGRRHRQDLEDHAWRPC